MVIVAVSLRFVAVQTITAELYKAGRPILPILLDDIQYPPANLDNLPRRLNPVECFAMQSRSEWQDTPEFNEIVDRLDMLIPSVKARRGLRNTNGTRIPQSKDTPKSQQRPATRGLPPQDPLAREAADITVRVKPPSPDPHDQRSHIPTKQQQQASSRPRPITDQDLQTLEKEIPDDGEHESDDEENEDDDFVENDESFDGRHE